MSVDEAFVDVTGIVQERNNSSASRNRDADVRGDEAKYFAEALRAEVRQCTGCESELINVPDVTGCFHSDADSS